MSISNKAILSLGFLTIATVTSTGAQAATFGDPNVFVDLAKKAVPSVVNISAARPMRASYGGGGQIDPRDLLGQLFGGGGPGGGGFGGRRGFSRGPAPKSVALGTGFVIDASGVILTNNHVVADADEIKIQLTESPTETPIEGKVIGRDPELDVALIKVNAPGKLVALPLGDSDALEVGEYVMAVGNPYGQGHSVSHGIVSAKGRVSPDIPLASYLQTDAPINPGNSGGPLLNLRGEVIGINNAIDARAQGISFAIPINAVKSVVLQLREHGRVARGYIGAEIAQLTPELAAKVGAAKDLRAPFVTNVAPGGPAERGGLRAYDVITRVGSADVHTPTELVLAITSSSIGKSVPVRVSRAGKTLDLQVKIAPRPGAPSVADAGSSSGKEDKDGANLAGMELAENGTGPDAHVVVSEVEEDSAAARAGIAPGDEILEVDRAPVKSVRQLRERVASGRSYLLRIKRTEGASGAHYAVVLLDFKPERAG